MDQISMGLFLMNKAHVLIPILKVQQSIVHLKEEKRNEQNFNY